MGYTIGEKLIKSHLLSGEMISGKEVGIKIDQTLTQDATGTMAYLEFEAMGVDRVKTDVSVSYIDHNTLQSGFENADDHQFIQSISKKHGMYFSRPGNGICHQVHLERFAVPGKTLIGSDSHTPTSGGMGMLAIGAGGLDVAVAMGGGAYYIPMPKMVRVNLHGKLRAWVSAKDIILEVLRILTVKGGVGKIIEYGGDAVKHLSVPERATITNMGAELGATTSVFPSDSVTKAFLEAQGRGDDWVELTADSTAVYERTIEMNLDELVPLAGVPHSPDNVASVTEIGEIDIDQVCIGSCTNSSLSDMLKVAAILDGKTVAPNVSLTISPGSMQVLSMLSSSGALTKMIKAGARILESACGPCIGMGQAPNSNGVSLRTFNRNFEGRSGTADAQVYLVSPEVAAASALAGKLVDPRTLGDMPSITMPNSFDVNDTLIISPANEKDAKDVQIVRGPNIKPFPETKPLAESIEAVAILKVGDNITTDHIMPAGAKILPLRSNIPKMSDYCFIQVDSTFPTRAKKAGKGIIIGGENYGQGSSREHAALVPLYLGIKAVISKSFARIHSANLVNAGIVPFTFEDVADYDKIKQGDELSLPSIRERLAEGKQIVLKNTTKSEEYPLHYDFSKREIDILLAGGLLNHTRESVIQ